MAAQSAAEREEALFGTRVKPEALKALKKQRTATLGELHDATGFAKSTISGAMNSLVTAGVVKPVTRGKTRKGFALTPVGEQLSVVIEELGVEASVEGLPALSSNMDSDSLDSVASYFTSRRPATRSIEISEDELTQPACPVVWAGRPALD